MSTSEISLINLSHWESGKRTIRFLYLASNTSFKVTKNSHPKEQMIPLFLGADLFSDTDIRTENHPRYHAKFARKGLATKLIFSSDFRFHGLRVPCASNSLWFYSIQGVFRVAFELYSKQEQLSVLESFQDLWKSRINDEPLNMTYDLRVQVDIQLPPGIVDTRNQELQSRLTSQDALGSSTGHPNANSSVEGGEAAPESDFNPSGDLSSADHDYCSSTELAASAEPTQLCPISQRLHSLRAKVPLVRNMGIQQQEAVLKQLEHTECCVSGQLDEEGLAASVLALLQTHTPGSSVYSSPLLQSVARWLGQQFHVANSSITHQVEGFKVQHIERITDLPPAEELAAELFPEAMRTLLIHWMGLSDEAALWKRHSEYPILLLILEFANHNLITGVAHVLYSSLICK